MAGKHFAIEIFSESLVPSFCVGQSVDLRGALVNLEAVMIRDLKRGSKSMAETAIEDFVLARERLRQQTLTTKDVAKRFGVSHVTVSSWVNNGLLKSCGEFEGLGRLFTQEDVESFHRPPRGPTPRD